MPKKPEAKNQTSLIENFPGDWGTLEDIAELEREAKAAMQLAIAAEAKVTAAKALAKKAAMNNLADLMTAAEISIYDLAEFMGASLQVPTTAKESKPAKDKTYYFRNPETGDLHSGRGKNAKWLEKAKKEGREEDFRIPADEFLKYNPHLQSV